MILKNENFANAIIKGNIVEFDMSAAGPSVMRAEGHIPDEVYKKILSYPKEIRQIKFGEHLRDYKLQPKKEEALDKYMELFLKENNIEDHYVIEIASDAIWMYNPPRIRKREFNEFVKFRVDRIASIMISFDGIKFYTDTWNGTFFTRGYKFEEKDAQVISIIMGIIESEESIPVLYKKLHQLKMMILKEEVCIKNKEYGSRFIDFLLISLI